MSQGVESGLPFDEPVASDQVTAASDQQPAASVQRAADVPAASAEPTPSVTALPFDDVEQIQMRRSVISRKPEAAAPPTVLPFDPVGSDAGAGDVQRATDMPDSGSEPAQPEPQRMDIFQALVAAGMVPKSSPPASSSPAPLGIQRSPSREAYLARRAQEIERQPNADPDPDSTAWIMESSRPVTPSRTASTDIRRAMTEDEVDQGPAQNDDDDDSEPQVDVNQLANDVMRILRDKLRSEKERLGKF